jgi:hypothetical protein
MGATTFEEVFTSLPREERDIPVAVARKEVKQADEDSEEESPQRFEMGRDPLDVPAFMRRRAYADTNFGS